LSYCWGGSETFKTEKNTLKDYEEFLPVDKLPQTIKDALSLTKAIGLDYLWVDAICIVQGNTQEALKEWKKESQNMGHIYSNAKIVLSATRSANVNEGLFMARSSRSLSEDIEAKECSIRARRNLNHEIITSCRTKSN
jgi:hypothetical protein